LQEIDEVVSQIEDGQWHPLEEIIKNIKLPKPKIHKTLEFLANHGFINYDSKNKKVKITASLTKFLEEDRKY
jgi:DNA-binding IclR family transcriptional regulator